MNRLDCHNDLVTRARRYRLSREERAKLDEHLGACPSCRLAERVGRDFDAIGDLQPGDDVLLLALADKFRRRRLSGMGRGRTRLTATAAAIACALLAAAAGAYAYMERGAALRAAPVEASLAAGRTPSPEQVELVARTVWSAPRTDAPAPPEETAASRHTTRRHARHAREDAPEVQSASVLFTNANAERRDGHAAEAIALYGELERLYPASEEALVSRVSLGRLLLARGMLQEALARLNEYLAAAPEGTLAPEALFGKARALEGLDRKSEERQAWERLLVRFPDSVYAAQAHHRIDDLR